MFQSIMRILCIIQNSPNELEPLAMRLAKDHEVFMASSRRVLPQANHPFRRIQLKKSDAGKYDHGYLGYLALALKTAHNTLPTWETMLSRGDSPDIILSCASNGLAFNMRHIFPAALIVSYPDSKLCNLYTRDRELYAARSLIQEIQYAQSDLRIVRYGEEKPEFENLGGKSFQHLPLFTDTDFYAPGAVKSGVRKIIFLGGSMTDREMEKLWHMIKTVLEYDHDCHIFVAAENSLRKFPWQQMISDLRENLSQRLKVELNLSPHLWRSELHSSSLVFCTRTDFSARQRILEAMSCGLPVLTSKPFESFGYGRNMLELTPGSLLVQINNALSRPDYLCKIGMNARGTVLAEHNMADILPHHIEKIFLAWREKNNIL